MGVSDFASGMPLVGSAFDDTLEDYRKELAKNQGIWEGIRPSAIQYEQYNPEMAQYQTVQEDPMLRSRQMSELDRLSGLSDTGYTDADMANMRIAANEANQGAAQARGAALQGAQARGMGGSGMDYATLEMANQGAANRANQNAMQVAGDSAKQKALYAQAYGEGLSGVRNQDYNVNSGNAGIINDFNMANTNASNLGQQYNIENKKGVAQDNVNNQFNWASGMSGANKDYATSYAAQNAARTDDRNARTQFLTSMLGATTGGKKGK